MSRIGKRPVQVPSGVTVSVEGQKVTARGPKGELNFVVNDEVLVKMEANEVIVMPASESRDARSRWGMSRTMIENIMTGVAGGFERRLEISGVGYRAAMQGKNLQLALGFSHDVDLEVPEGITVNTPDQTTVEISGLDKQAVGQFAAEVREFRKPEPYKGKGIKYRGEYIFRKEGKKK